MYDEDEPGDKLNQYRAVLKVLVRQRMEEDSKPVEALKEFVDTIDGSTMASRNSSVESVTFAEAIADVKYFLRMTAMIQARSFAGAVQMVNKAVPENVKRFANLLNIEIISISLVEE